MSRRGLLLTLTALVAGQASPAAAWVRSRTDGCHPVYWPTSCVHIKPDSALTKDLPDADTKRIIQKSIANWQNLTTGSFLKLNYAEPDGPTEARYDLQPTIKFRTGKWCRPGDCSGDKETCHDASAAAITTVFYVNKPDDPAEDGKILDADIEMNSVNNQFYDADKAPSTVTGRTLADLENTLVHELGHLMGLDHTCRNASTPACVVDDKGARPPLCSEVIAKAATDPASKVLYDATMFASAQPRETKKRVPQPDDVAAINGIYPSAKDPRSCPPAETRDQCGGGEDPKGCAVAASPVPVPGTGAGLPLLLLGGLLLAARRLRRAR